MAGSGPGSEGDKAEGRVSFISEGEASLWFALRHGLPEGTMEVRPRLFPRSFCPFKPKTDDPNWIERRGRCHRRRWGRHD